MAAEWLRRWTTSGVSEGVTLLNFLQSRCWIGRTGELNARYRELQLLHQSLGAGDRIVKATLRSSDVFVAAYVSP
jgi:hypothetical protein